MSKDLLSYIYDCFRKSTTPCSNQKLWEKKLLTNDFFSLFLQWPDQRRLYTSHARPKQAVELTLLLAFTCNALTLMGSDTTSYETGLRKSSSAPQPPASQIKLCRRKNLLGVKRAQRPRSHFLESVVILDDPARIPR